MLKITTKNINQYILVLAFTVIAGLILLTPSKLNAQASSLAYSESSSNGALGGAAYLSNDSSAYSGTKVTFGNPNFVSFSDLKHRQTPVKISVGNLSDSTPISPLDFGTNEIWYDGGYGAQNLSTNQLYSSLVALTKTIGVSIIRYPGGIPSDTFHWQSAIGPQNQRSRNVVYQAQKVFFPSTFGPDEFGQLLQKTGSAGDITVNFGTGTASEAADWVQYMTSPSNNNYWGALRAKNGHPTPYNIPYWEVGNEQQSKEYYWRAGTLVSLNDNNHCASTDVHLCEYVYGGVTKFTKQATISPSNEHQGNGTASQVFYAEYPPVVAESQTVYVNGKVWNPVTNIATTTAKGAVYEFNTSSGKITFGNGLHGAQLPLGAVVTISYESGPHDGFTRYYDLMKAADPNAQVCSSYDSAGFLELMGSTLPYDCLVFHPYGEQIPSSVDPVLFHNSLIQQSYGFSKQLSTQQAEIKKYAGIRAKDVNLAITEYGVNALTSPSGQADYHRSQDIALFDANLLKTIITHHIPVAEKHYLISYVYSNAPGLQTFVNSSTFADNAIISGPGSDPVAQPSAYVLEAYTKLLFTNLISSSIQNNPPVVYSGGSYPSLSVLATTDKKGDEAIMVMNLSLSNNILTEIQPSVNTYKTAIAWTLGANNVLAYNTLSDPNAVSFVMKSAATLTGNVFASFPPGSITVMQFSK